MANTVIFCYNKNKKIMKITSFLAAGKNLKKCPSNFVYRRCGVKNLHICPSKRTELLQIDYREERKMDRSEMPLHIVM
jgi:hypothetical protein